MFSPANVHMQVFMFIFFLHSAWKLSVQLALYHSKLLLINSVIIYVYDDFGKEYIFIQKWWILLTQNSPSECPGIVRVILQRNLWATLKMLILKSQYFLPPITLVFLPGTITSIKNTMPLKTKCIIIKFIPILSTCKPHLSIANKTFCHHPSLELTAIKGDIIIRITIML